ncbi:hypothetical protein D3C80_1843330 [compost metagenome]
MYRLPAPCLAGFAGRQFFTAFVGQSPGELAGFGALLCQQIANPWQEVVQHCGIFALCRNDAQRDGFAAPACRLAVFDAIDKHFQLLAGGVDQAIIRRLRGRYRHQGDKSGHPVFHR